MKENKKKTDRKELFETTPVWNAIFALTIPMIISSLVSLVYNLSDTYFVGALNDSIQNAAITLAAPAMTLFYGVTNLFGIGASSLMSRSMGVKDTETVKKASATGLYFALGAAALLSFVILVFNNFSVSLLVNTLLIISFLFNFEAKSYPIALVSSSLFVTNSSIISS